MKMGSGNTFVDWLIATLDSWALYSSLRNTLKAICHQLSGRCELQRICDAGAHGSKATKRVEHSLYHSRHEDLRRILTSEESDINKAMNNIVFLKRINPEEDLSFRLHMPQILNNIVAYNILRSEVDSIRSIAYDESNDSHEAKLMQLWHFLKPETPLESRITKQWGEIGFQGKNPATDFRGMGILTLENLLFLFKENPREARKVFNQSQHPKYGFPFAVVAINITGMVVELLKTGVLKSYFYELDIQKFSYLHVQKMFARLFCDFGTFYIAQEPENVMAFNSIKAQYQELLTTKLNSGDAMYFEFL